MMYIFYLISAIFNSMIFSQSWNNHPELNWHTIETDHFFIHYHDETYRSATEASIIAEKIYKPVTELYEFEPESKTHIIIKDTDDMSNGSAYYYDNKIEIWAMPMDYDLRGSHRWINNVIVHEFIHIVQIGASMKYSIHFPAFYFQMMDYEDEKRDDVLYGYPNKLISYPVPGTAIPPWLAEGTAQIMYPEAGFDFWDSHRDMILRDRFLNNNVLSFNSMNTFGKKGIGNESVYNQGFSFVRFLVNNYGIEVLNKISYFLSKKNNYSINKALLKTTGIKGADLYSQWKNFTRLDYINKVSHIEKNDSSITMFAFGGTTNIHPVWSPSDSQFAFISNMENDFFSQTDLFVYNFSDSSTEKISKSVRTAPSWVSDSTIIYSKKSFPNKFGSVFYDLYEYNFNTDKKNRLTKNQRMTSPIYNKIQNQIAAISTYDGTSNIFITNYDSIDFKQVTFFNDGFQIFSIDWNDGKIIADVLDHHGRFIVSIDKKTGDFTKITDNSGIDCRDPVLHNNQIIYSKDESGIYNIYINNNGNNGYVTNVLGGAFMPNVSNSGNKLLFSLYENGRYNVGIKNLSELSYYNNIGYAPDSRYQYKESDLIKISLEEDIHNIKSEKYKERMSKISILPRLLIDYKTIKPGFYFYNSEILNRLNILGGVSLNNRKDFDVVLMFDYNKLLPTLFSNLYWVSRHIEYDDPKFYERENGTIVENIQFFDKFYFTLFSGDVGARIQIAGQKLWMYYNYSNYRQNIYRKIYQITEYNNEIDTSAWHPELAFDYFRGHSITLRFLSNNKKSSFLKTMLPIGGFSIDGTVSKEWNNFISGFGVNEEYSTFGSVLSEHNTMRFLLDMKLFFQLIKKRKLVNETTASFKYISNKEIDDFFYFFGGGLTGLKGYTFYDSQLTSSNNIIISNYLRVPLFLEKNYKFLHIYFQNLTVGLASQKGKFFYNKWNEYNSNGIELRLKGYSFFAYPFAINYELYWAEHFNGSPKHYLKLLFDF